MKTKTKKKRAAKPRGFRSGSRLIAYCWTGCFGGLRAVQMCSETALLESDDAKLFSAWLLRAAEWCKEQP